MFSVEGMFPWSFRWQQLVVPGAWVLWVLAAVLFVWLAFLRKPRHAWRIRKGERVLRRLQLLQESGGMRAQFGFLRSKAVDPYCFEEAILSALAFRGVKIRRNERYSGDGGIDGRVWLDGRLVYIQAKLYSHAIAAEHVRQFSELCRRKGALGLFVHSGRTGPKSRKFQSAELDIVSGQRLMRLLCGEELVLFPHGLEVSV